MNREKQLKCAVKNVLEPDRFLLEVFHAAFQSPNGFLAVLAITVLLKLLRFSYPFSFLADRFHSTTCLGLFDQ